MMFGNFVNIVVKLTEFDLPLIDDLSRSKRLKIWNDIVGKLL